MVKVVVLDVDGTLMDTNYQHTETWARALAEVGRLTPAADETIAVGTWDIVAVKASRIRTVAVLTGARDLLALPVACRVLEALACIRKFLA
jgi:phosphoglycolate phosphatase-like HAD superfamily hydrolase